MDPVFADEVKILFAPLAAKPGVSAFPPIASLSIRLEELLEKAIKASPTSPSLNIPPTEFYLFATAAVEMWQRAVHSYLISASLTEASPVWASVSGYYSSHYSVRSLAHLLGHFQLYGKKKIVRIQTIAKKQVCSFDKKQGSDREHKAYWKIVKSHALFRDDPLFTLNPSDTDPSDVAHRDRANYADHIGKFPIFRPLNDTELKNRVNRISQMTFDVPPIPRKNKFPQVDAVQIVAYHRLVKVRSLLDEVLGSKNRYWNGNRNPSWATILNFQLSDQRSISSLAN